MRKHNRTAFLHDSFCWTTTKTVSTRENKTYFLNKSWCGNILSLLYFYATSRSWKTKILCSELGVK